jgi:hypothetical protein
MEDGEIISMQVKILKLAQIGAGVGVLAMAFASPAAAKTHYTHAHWRTAYRYHHRSFDDRPLTVTSRRQREPIIAAPDPFRGPGAIVTGPNAVAATLVSLPFRAAAVVFPPYGDPADNPLVLVGAPVRVAGQIAELPFWVVGSAFGAPPNLVY